MDEANINNKDAKKKLALLIAGGITVLIFAGWIFYFISKTIVVIDDTKEEVALFIKLKQNTDETFGNMGSVFLDIGKKISSVGEYYGKSLSTVATTSEETTINTTTIATTTIENNQ